MCFGIFCKRVMFQRKYHWVKMKYLGSTQNRYHQLLCRRDNAFFSIYIINCRMPTWIRNAVYGSPFILLWFSPRALWRLSWIVSTPRHSCGFACQQRLLKTLPGPGYLSSEDGVVWLWNFLEILHYMYIIEIFINV